MDLDEYVDGLGESDRARRRRLARERSYAITDYLADIERRVDDADNAADYETGPHWYRRGFSIDDVFRARTNLLNSTKRTNVDVRDAWDGFVGVQREVAIADRPVDVEVTLDGALEIDLDVGPADVATPTGPRATAESADLAEKTDWTGASAGRETGERR